MAVHYILNGKTPMPISNILEWAKWYETHNRTVEKTEIRGIIISTVFLGIDHNYSKEGNPILFETMIFKWNDDYCERYSTWDEALEGHHKACQIVIDSL
jgi:hypothetical protein